MILSTQRTIEVRAMCPSLSTTLGPHGHTIKKGPLPTGSSTIEWLINCQAGGWIASHFSTREERRNRFRQATTMETVEEAGTPSIEPRVRSGLSRGAVVKAIPGAVLAVVAVVFSVQNLDSIDVDFLAWSFDLPLVLIMVISAVVGVVLWELVGYLRSRRQA